MQLEKVDFTRMAKLKEQLFSRNFWIQIINSIYLAFTANDIIIGKTPEELYDIFTGSEGTGLLIAISIYAIPTIVSIFEKVKNNVWSWDWVKSSNFMTVVISIVTIVVGSFLDEQLASIVITILTNVINIAFHSGKPAKIIQMEINKAESLAA